MRLLAIVATVLRQCCDSVATFSAYPALANEGGVQDVTVLCAAVLHDTIEDTETTADELRALFGDQVASVVLEVTDDKISNLRDILASPPADWSPERKQAYFDWTAKVIAGLRSVHPGLEAVFDGRSGPSILSRLVFKGCAEDVRAILRFVTADRTAQYVAAPPRPAFSGQPSQHCPA